MIGSFLGIFALLLLLLVTCGLALCYPLFEKTVFRLVQRFRKIDSFDSPWNFKTHLSHIGYCFLSWVLFGSAVFVLVQALSASSFSFNLYFKIHFLAITSYLLGRILFLMPAGLGITEGGLVWGLSQSLSMEIAVWAAFLFRILLIITLLFTWTLNFSFYCRRKGLGGFPR